MKKIWTIIKTIKISNRVICLIKLSMIIIIIMNSILDNTYNYNNNNNGNYNNSLNDKNDDVNDQNTKQCNEHK
jgi:hypothetical protein